MHSPTTAEILAPGPLGTPEQDHQSCAATAPLRSAADKRRILAHLQQHLAELREEALDAELARLGLVSVRTLDQFKTMAAGCDTMSEAPDGHA